MPGCRVRSSVSVDPFSDVLRLSSRSVVDDMAVLAQFWMAVARFIELRRF
jgi:hypothetical protein